MRGFILNSFSLKDQVEFFNSENITFTMDGSESINVNFEFGDNGDVLLNIDSETIIVERIEYNDDNLFLVKGKDSKGNEFEAELTSYIYTKAFNKENNLKMNNIVLSKEYFDNLSKKEKEEYFIKNSVMLVDYGETYIDVLCLSYNENDDELYMHSSVNDELYKVVSIEYDRENGFVVKTTEYESFWLAAVQFIDAFS